LLSTNVNFSEMPGSGEKTFDFRDGFSAGAISSSIQVDFSENNREQQQLL
jgi:hypothetical protein